MSSKARTYRSVEFATKNGTADEAAGILVANGALGCEVVGRRNSRNAPTLLRSWFEQITPRQVMLLRRILDSAGMLAEQASPQVQQITDPGWATIWQKRFTPLNIGRRLTVVPPWHRGLDPDRLQIIIRPGQAFGTGHHPSTAGTVCVVEELCAGGPVRHALDVGTGSGILAIAMAKLGVHQVTAIDIDRLALVNAAENARLNRVSRRIRFSSTALSAVGGRFRLITANILSSVLVPMASELAMRLEPGGSLVLAGILRREAPTVARAYRPELEYVGARNDGAWTALILRR